MSLQVAGPYTCSYSGKLCGPAARTPPLHDIAVALGRICRFAGNGIAFYTVLPHSMTVADLLPLRLKPYGLLHDSPEAAMGDAPTQFKTAEFKAIEEVYYPRILASFGLPPLSDEDAHLVHVADQEAFLGEVWTVGPGYLRNLFPDRSKIAEGLTMGYLREFPAEECINPGGRAVIEFMRRVENSLEAR